MKRTTKYNPKNKPADSIPTISLSRAVEELTLINESVFKIKLGLHELLAAIDKGDMRRCKIIVETMDLKNSLNNLTPEYNL